MAAQRVDQDGALAHQEVAGLVDHQRPLLFSRLQRHEPHRRTLNRLANGLGIEGVVLAALDVRLHVARRYHADLVSQPAELSRPVMRCRAGLHADETRRQTREKRHHLGTTQSPTDNHRAVVGNSVDLEDVLREIESNRAYLDHGRFLSFVAPQMMTTLWHIDAGEEGPSTPSKGREI